MVWHQSSLNIFWAQSFRRIQFCFLQVGLPGTCHLKTKLLQFNPGKVLAIIQKLIHAIHLLFFLYWHPQTLCSIFNFYASNVYSRLPLLAETKVLLGWRIVINCEERIELLMHQQYHYWAKRWKNQTSPLSQYCLGTA